MPSAAVIIPTHNRVELLRKVIDSVRSQTVPAEILVMDDASSDGTETAIRAAYPQVQFHREATSKGPTFQRNKAAALTNAQILFTIDDDCVLTSPRTFEQTLAAFDHPRIGAVTLPFLNVLQDKTVHTTTTADGIIAMFDYYGGMVALRRDVFLGVGGYRSYLFIQVEEQDLAVRMLDAGYIVRCGKADPLEHMESPSRDRPGRDRQGPRNFILYSFYNVPWPDFPIHLAGTTAYCLRHGLHEGTLPRVIRGLGQGYAGILHEWGKRAPVPRKTYKLSRLLKRRGSMPLEELEPILPPIKAWS